MAERRGVPPVPGPAAPTTEITLPAGKRVCWGAVLAGAIIVLAVQTTVVLLGLAIGFGSAGTSAAGLGIRPTAWWTGSSLLALFIGSWVAGRLAGIPRATIGLVHGLLVWAVSALATVYLATTAAGLLVAGALGIVQTGLATAGPAMGPVAEEHELPALQRGTAWTAARQEARQLLDRAQAMGARHVRPLVTDDDLDAALAGLLRHGTWTVPVEPDAMVNVLRVGVGLARRDAEALAERWVRAYDEAARAELTSSPARETPHLTSGLPFNVMAEASRSAFVAIVLGAAIGALGGALGSPRDIVVERF